MSYIELKKSSHTNPKSPESKDNNDEVHSVSQEHEHIDVCHSAVLGVDQVIEELTDRDIDLKGTEWKKRSNAYCYCSLFVLLYNVSYDLTDNCLACTARYVRG